MYGETELERQTREAESAQTDSILAQLFPQAQQLPEITVQASTLPLFLALVAGLWFFGNKSGRRSLWILAVCLLVSNLSAQMPAGLMQYNDMDEWCALPMSATYSSFEPSKVMAVLRKAKQCKIGIVVVYPRRLYTTNGQNIGPYSPARHRALSDLYAKMIPPDTLNKYVTSRTLLGIITGDDYGCKACWGGTAIPWTEARDAANYAKRKLPNAPIGVRLDALKMANVNGWKIDFGWAQWIATKANLRKYGGSKQWFTDNTTTAKRLNVSMFYGINTTHCYASGNRPECSASDVLAFGTPAVNQPNNCGFISWRWDEEDWKGAYKASWVSLLNKSKNKPFTSCKRR